jgi:flagellar operon protein
MVEKPFLIPQPIQPHSESTKAHAPTVKDKQLFNEILQSQLTSLGDVKFSRHAQERILQRKINLKHNHLLRLQDAVKKAQVKGARESLVLLDDLAFVVSVKNNTVITAVDGNSRKGNVFTNIDSAIIN